ncbi:MAG: phosphonate ABC transporter, permease protein PhnE, partial [Nitrospinota bacterium]|nr:phosphonate ABC transporter, permease protein PhnE [Nitrospinota bacterium]
MNTAPPIKPFYTRTRFILLILVAGIIYTYGWKVTQIQPGNLIRDFHLVKPLISALLHPDLITRETDSLTTEARFELADVAGAETDISAPADPSPGLQLSRTEGSIGDTLAVEGFHLPAQRQGQLFWVNSIEQEFPLGEIASDATGRFYKEITVPPTARGEVQQVRAVLTWETGGWQFSHALKLTVDKIVETLFLGLMASTLAIMLAGPLSFLGARN